MNIRESFPLPGEVSVMDFAEKIGVAVGTVRRWVHEGMPVRRTTRERVFVTPEHAEAWILEHARGVSFHRNSLIYFVRRDDGAVKIGWTSDFGRRLQELRKENRTTITILAVIPGDKPDELRLQKRFGAQRLDGEWFADSEEFRVFIDQIRGVAA